MATNLQPKPFRSDVPDAAIDELRDRLRRTRWPTALVDDWSDGSDLGYVRELCAYWADGFDWRAPEARLNAFDQVLVPLDGFEIHAIHARSPHAGALPIVITHGWPGSIFEMLDIIPRLTDPTRFGGDARDAFHVVVPSLPGYGFSSKPVRPGTDPAAIATLWTRLMTALGYERFGAQGGDWGATVTSYLAFEHADRLIGAHLNFLPARLVPGRDALGDAATADERAFFDATDAWQEAEGAYGHIQATKPETVAFGLADSPAGLAAYIVEKLRSWSDCDGRLENAISRDAALANVSLYWFTNAIASSVHLYWERRNANSQPPARRSAVPVAFAIFPKELGGTPVRSLAERSYDVRRWTTMPHGGHFAALEQPALLGDDVAAFFRALR